MTEPLPPTPLEYRDPKDDRTNWQKGYQIGGGLLLGWAVPFAVQVLSFLDNLDLGPHQHPWTWADFNWAVPTVVTVFAIVGIVWVNHIVRKRTGSWLFVKATCAGFLVFLLMDGLCFGQMRYDFSIHFRD